MKKRWIALLTDFGYCDAYVAQMKAVILSKYPSASILDISHGIAPQHIVQGAVMLEDSYHWFPRGTVFVGVVDPGVGTHRHALAIKTKDYFFVGPDNGLLIAAVSREKQIEVRQIINSKMLKSRMLSTTFHGRDVFAPAAALLAKKPLLFASLGPVLKKYIASPIDHAIYLTRQVQGVILYFDTYGNAITNILSREVNNLAGQCKVRVNHKHVVQLVASYENAGTRPVALWNSSGRLEIAVRNGSAQKKLKLKQGNPVTLKG